MAERFTTGSAELDALLEELRAGDNVVFYTADGQLYLPFVSSLLAPDGGAGHDGARRIVYVRSAGLLDDLVARADGVEVLDIAALVGDRDPVAGLQAEMRRIGPRVYYLFEPLHTLSPSPLPPEGLVDFFLAICPLLYQLETICYWNLVRGRHTPADLAAIKDCTQVFVQVDRAGPDVVLTPVKVWGRYSDAMFRPHRVVSRDGHLSLERQAVPGAEQRAYAASLEAKNRELAEIRDALDGSNRALQERNRELAELNERLREQSRRYRALHNSLDHLLDLLQARQTISSSLVVDQVRAAVVDATMRLFDASACRLDLSEGRAAGGGRVERGVTAEWEGRFALEEVARAREGVRRTLRPAALCLGDGEGAVVASVALAAVAPRGQCLGTLEVGSHDDRLGSEESLSFLGYLASEASIALDNARLYREVEDQGAQLRTFLEDMIATEEAESRRFAYDLHDGLVQIIVAAFQHLQSAQAWRGRDPQEEERELDQGTQLLRRSIYEARRLIARLRPTGLDDFGLTHALRLHVAQIAQDADWEVTLDVSPDWPTLPSSLEAALFRIAQEASTNALKYAASPRLHIALDVAEGELRLIVRDWGQGFDPEQAMVGQERGRRVGLIGMRERARLWGGECTVQSEPGAGTTITVTVPVPQEVRQGEGSAS